MEELLQGYVVRSIPYLENDAILTVITEQKGIISFKARGIQKPTSKNNPSCQLFVKGEYLLDYKQDSGHRNLRTGMVQDSIPSLFYHSTHLLLLTLASEGLLKLEESYDEQVYSFLDALYQIIKSASFDYATATLVLLAHFMERSGCRLVADACVCCGSTKEISAVDYDEGGYLCDSCRAKRNKNSQPSLYLKFFRIVMKAELQNIPQFVVPPEVAMRMTFDFFSYLEKQVGIRFKSQELMMQQFGLQHV